MAENLIALGFCIAGKVGDVQRKRGPESDHTGERGEKVFPELPLLRLADIKGGRLRQHRPEPARLAPRPPEQQQPQRDEQRRFDVQQDADGINATIDDIHVDSPKQHEAGELAAIDAKPVRSRRGLQIEQRATNLVDRVATDPCLDAEPTARHQRTQNCGDIRAQWTKRGAAINGEWDSVARPGVGVEDHRHKHDEVAEEDREDSLPPIHATADER